MQIVFDELDYEPSPLQNEFHRYPARVRLVAGGERGGKSFSAAMDMTARMVYLSAMGRDGDQMYWIMGPDYYQPRAEFEYVYAALLQLGFRTAGKPSMPSGQSSAWVMQVMGIGEIATKTSSDIKKIASFPLDGVLMAEAAQQEYDAYLRSRGRIAEKRGWMILSGTFESSLGWYADLFTEWQLGVKGAKSFSLPSWSNLKVYPGGRDDPEIKLLEAQTPHDKFMERYGAVPYKPASLVFKEFNYQVHVREDIVYNDKLPVYLAVDPGYDPGYYHVSAMQVHRAVDGPEQVWQVDEIHVQKMTGPEVIELAKTREWWKNVQSGVIDVAGRQHHAMKSQVDVWLEMANVYLVSQPVGILDGIERHRTFLVDPGTRKPRLFHNPECTGTLREYSLYKRPEDKESRRLIETPIDRDNHAMKAIAYFLYDRYGPVRRRKRKVGRVATL